MKRQIKTKFGSAGLNLTVGLKEEGRFKGSERKEEGTRWTGSVQMNQTGSHMSIKKPLDRFSSFLPFSLSLKQFLLSLLSRKITPEKKKSGGPTRWPTGFRWWRRRAGATKLLRFKIFPRFQESFFFLNSNPVSQIQKQLTTVLDLRSNTAQKKGKVNYL